MRNKLPGNVWHSSQWSIGENTIVVLRDGLWFRLERWKQQGYWVTWSKQQRFGERLGYEIPVWQIGKGKKFRIACFTLGTPGWYYDKKEKTKSLYIVRSDEEGKRKRSKKDT